MDDGYNHGLSDRTIIEIGKDQLSLSSMIYRDAPIILERTAIIQGNNKLEAVAIMIDAMLSLGNINSETLTMLFESVQNLKEEEPK